MEKLKNSHSLFVAIVMVVVCLIAIIICLITFLSHTEGLQCMANPIQYTLKNHPDTASCLCNEGKQGSATTYFTKNSSTVLTLGHS